MRGFEPPTPSSRTRCATPALHPELRKNPAIRERGACLHSKIQAHTLFQQVFAARRDMGRICFDARSCRKIMVILRL